MPAELVDFRETGSVRRDPCGPARRRSGDDIAARVPLTILNGLPRRGQDTLLNRILNGDTGLRVAVIVNDFGSINIDAELVVGVESDVISSRERLRVLNGRDDLIESVVGTALPA